MPAIGLFHNITSKSHCVHSLCVSPDNNNVIIYIVSTVCQED